MGQALYRKYRSKSLEEIVGQEHITQTLHRALEQGRISHAYLFTGPRGVGKTSIARIWAHAINDAPYNGETHLDIIEIDAASNRRIDEIRDLRDKVHVAPTSLKYKVYIIDEVHMLTREAFNALLKTLEEPPEHAVFILATTDVHKLPETIVSRTQRFNFKAGEKRQIASHLRSLAEQENIKISDDALALLAEAGDGSFRDSVSLLDQAGSQGQALELEDVQRLLGVPSQVAVQQLIEAILQGQPAATIMTALSQLYQQGFQASSIAKQIAQTLRDDLTTQQEHDTELVLPLLEQLLSVPTSHQPDRFLEIVLLAARPAVQIQTPAQSQPKSASTPAPKTPPAPAKPTPTIQEHIDTPTTTAEPKAPKQQVAQPEPVQAGSASLDAALWPEILKALKQKHNTIYGIVRMAQPTFRKEGLTLAFAFAFHQKRINEASSRKLLDDVIHDLTGQSVQIECTVDKAAKPSPPTIETPLVPTVTPEASAKSATSPDLSNISNIFGGAELLES